MSFSKFVAVVHHEGLGKASGVTDWHVVVFIVGHSLYKFPDAGGGQWLKQNVLQKPLLDQNALENEFLFKFEHVLLEEVLRCQPIVCLRVEMTPKQKELHRDILWKQDQIACLMIELLSLNPRPQELFLQILTSEHPLIFRHLEQ